MSSLRVGQLPGPADHHRHRRRPRRLRRRHGPHARPARQTVTLNGNVTVDGQIVSYAWGGVSPFTEPGDYSVDVVLTSPGVVDYTTTDTIEVYR